MPSIKEYEPPHSVDTMDVDDLGLGYRSSSSSDQEEYIPRKESRSHHSSTRRTFSHFLALKDRDAKQLHKILILTFQKLDQESQRASSAERNLAAALLRVRSEVDARQAVEAEASRAREELGMYKVQLEQAQREIYRAQEILDETEARRRDAEEEAARARSLARKFKQERVIDLAREDGRTEGYQKGWRVGFDEAEHERRARRVHEVLIEDDEEEESPPPSGIERPRHRTRSAPSAPPLPRPVTVMPEPEVGPEHIPDVAPFASAPTIPTITTPFRPPSRTASQPRTPAATQYRSHTPSARRGSTSASRPYSPQSSQPSIIHPQPSLLTPIVIPAPAAPVTQTVHPVQRRATATPMGPDRSPSPMHRRSPVPPDNYIPYAEVSPNGSRIYLPPPHELHNSMPMTDDGYVNIPTPVVERVYEDEVSPVSALPPSRNGPYEPRQVPSNRGEVRTRDYAYGSRGPTPAPVWVPPPQRLAQAPSTHSRASTNVSEFELVNPVQVPAPPVYHTRPRTTSQPQPFYTNPPPVPVPIPGRSPSRGSDRTAEDSYRRVPPPQHILQRMETQPQQVRMGVPSSGGYAAPPDRSQSRQSSDRMYTRPRYDSGASTSQSDRPARPVHPRRASSAPGITVEPPSPEGSPPSPTATVQTTTDHRFLSPEIQARPLTPSLHELEAALHDTPSRPPSPRHYQPRERSQSRAHPSRPPTLTPLQELSNLELPRNASSSSNDSMPTPVPPRSSSHSRSHRSETPTPSRHGRRKSESPSYQTAPIPPGVEYPTTPLANVSNLAGATSGSPGSSRRRQAEPVPEQTTSESTVQTESSTATNRPQTPGESRKPSKDKHRSTDSSGTAFPGDRLWRRYTSH